ncbi:MAG: DVU0298 family protein [Thermodesulfobacteriota bacterium]
MPMTGKRLNKPIVACLRGESLDAVLTAVRQWPPRRVISPLIGALCRGDERVRWHAVSALGAVTAALAETEPEAARTVIRRLMWSLNDESGGIGWGAPEALAEIMALHRGCAEEFGHILVAYMRPDGSYLALPALQRGLMWGLGRLAGSRPDLLRKWDAPVYLQPYLDSGDPEVRGLAARALGLLKETAARKRIEALKGDTTPLTLYHEGNLTPVTAGSLAQAALERISGDA